MTYRSSYEEPRKRTKELKKEALMRKQAEDAANLQRETLARVFEIAPHIMILVDKDGRITNINDAGAAFAGKPKDESLGLFCGEVFNCLNSFDGPGCGRNAPCLTCPVRTKIMYTFETGQGIRDAEGRLVVRKGSTDVPVEVLISTALVKDNHADKVLVTITEITERTLAQAELFNSRQLLRSILDNIPQRVFWKDRNSVIIGCNKAFALDWGYEDPSDLVGKTDYEVTSADIADLFRADDREVMETGWPKLNYEEPFIRADGSLAWLITSKVPMFDPDGQVSGVLGTFQDTTEHKLAEDALRESERKYRELVENANSIIVRMDNTGNLTFLNEFAQDFFGYSEEEILGKNVVGTIVPEVESTTGRDLRLMIEDIAVNPDRYANNENENMRKNEERVWIAWTNKPLFDENGRIKEILCIGNDMTRRKRAEDALRESEERFSRLFHASPVGTSILRLIDNKFADANDSFLRLFGYTREEVIGKTPSDLGIWVNPEDRTKKVEILRSQGRLKDFETQFRWKSGEIGDVLFSTEVIEVAGERYVLCLTFDITARKQAEEALSLRESYLRAILENQPGLVWLKGKEGRFLAVNQTFARSCGIMRPEEVLGKTDLDIWPIELAEKYMNEDKAVMTAGAPFVVEETINVRGKVEWFETFKTPVIDKEGQILGTTGFARPITERKFLEEALKKVNEGLESQVDERTKELSAKTRSLEEFNTALKVLLKQREEYKTELEESILLNVKGLLVPYIEKLKKGRLGGEQMSYLTIIESNIQEITSPFTKRLLGKYLGLTNVEVQAANLIKEGKTTKEIAELLNVSENTVSSIRFHIRKKLDLTHKKINLRHYLKSLSK